MVKEAQPKILISIVNWMNYWDTIRCVELCKEQAYKNIQILVVDNASVNESVEKISAAHPDIILYRNKKNKGFAGGHAVSYKYALENNFDAIWLLNPDAEVFNDTLLNLVEAYKQYGPSIYGSVNIDPEGKYLTGGGFKIKEDNSIDYSFDFNEHYKSKPVAEIGKKIEKTSSVQGSSFFIPMDVARKIGFMAKKYFLFIEEYDYCYRVYRNNFYCYLVYTSRILHRGSNSFRISEKLEWVRIYYSTRNFILFAIKNKLYTRKVIRANNGGVKNILKHALQRSDMKLHYEKLGLLHGYIGISGKRLDPDKFIDQN